MWNVDKLAFDNLIAHINVASICCCCSLGMQQLNWMRFQMCRTKTRRLVNSRKNRLSHSHTEFVAALTLNFWCFPHNSSVPCYLTRWLFLIFWNYDRASIHPYIYVFDSNVVHIGTQHHVPFHYSDLLSSYSPLMLTGFKHHFLLGGVPLLWTIFGFQA